MSTISTESEYKSQLQNIHNTLSNISAPECDKHILESIKWITNNIIQRENNNVEKKNDADYDNICKIINGDLTLLGINSSLLNEIREIGGCVTGSLLYRAIVNYFYALNFKISDVDIILPQSNNVDMFNQCLYPGFYKEFNKLNLIKTSSTSYELVDNLHCAQMYENKNKSIRINIIIISKSCTVSDFIKSFDIGCCKNYYDGKKLVSFDFENTKHLKSTVTYNKISVDKIYRGNKLYLAGKNVSPSSLIKTELYKEYKKLQDIYSLSEELRQKFSATECDKFQSHMTTHADYNKIITINKYFPIIEKMNSHNMKPGNNEITQDVIDIMNMIRCFDRIVKYQTRGITDFIIC